jgi:outer membrane protein assembly factor BamB
MRIRPSRVHPRRAVLLLTAVTTAALGTWAWRVGRLSSEANDGQRVYEAYCAHCHATDRSGGPGPSLLHLSPSWKTQVDRMPPGYPGVITSDQRVMLSAYLQTAVHRETVAVDSPLRRRPLCTLELQGGNAFQADPVLQDSTLFLTSGPNTFAIDSRSCRLRWSSSWLQGRSMVANRGVALGSGLVIRGTAEGTLLALDAQTGALRWSQRLADNRKGETFAMPPSVSGNLVFIAPAGGDNPTRGWIGAFRITSGSRIWRTELAPIPGPMGGGIWTRLVVDGDRLYAATGNASPAFAPEGQSYAAGGVVSLRARTGEIIWRRVLRPGDDHDWDVNHVGPLLDHSLIVSGKDGWVRSLEANTGTQRWETAVSTVINDRAPVIKTGTHACPGMAGGISIHGPIYDSVSKQLFVPSVEWCGTFYRADTLRRLTEHPFLGGAYRADNTRGGRLTALDPETGKIRWQYHSTTPLVGGVAMYGHQVLAGDLTGDLLALEARDGRVSWRGRVNGAIAGGILVYKLGGHVYAAVLSGQPGAMWGTSDLSSPPTVSIFLLQD